MAQSSWARFAGTAALLLLTGATVPLRGAPPNDSGSLSWNPGAAAAYLDQRISWWADWPKAARDHDTFCISCHTALPYALARRALGRALGETGASANERRVIDNVLTRVRMQAETDPYYSDQSSGPGKTAESRGTEAIFNALILVWRDAPTGVLSDDARLALKNMWALQLRSGDASGSWSWIEFHNAPWEGGSQFYGTVLAAIAVGSAPGNYREDAAVQPGLGLMSDWLARNMDAQTPADRIALLWASAKLPRLLTREQQQRIVAEILAHQRADGGLSISTLVGSWTRKDHTPVDPASDGYATGLAAFTLEQLDWPETRAPLKKSLDWLMHNQVRSDGRWASSSLNRERPLESDAGRFMSDAATAYAALALMNAR